MNSFIQIKLFFVVCLFASAIYPQENIFEAIRSNSSEFVKSLRHGDQRINAYEKDTGKTPLLLAIEQNDETDALYLAIQLVERGAIINQPNSQNGMTPLHMAAQQDFPILVFYLLKMGANPNLTNNENYNVWQFTHQINRSSMARWISFFYGKIIQQRQSSNDQQLTKKDFEELHDNILQTYNNGLQSRL